MSEPSRILGLLQELYHAGELTGDDVRYQGTALAAGGDNDVEAGGSFGDDGFGLTFSAIGGREVEGVEALRAKLPAHLQNKLPQFHVVAPADMQNLRDTDAWERFGDAHGLTRDQLIAAQRNVSHATIVATFGGDSAYAARDLDGNVQPNSRAYPLGMRTAGAITAYWKRVADEWLHPSDLPFVAGG